MEQTRPQSYRSWLLGEIVLVALLSSATALFALSSSLQSSYPLPEARLVLDTAVAVVAAIVSCSRRCVSSSTGERSTFS